MKAFLSFSRINLRSFAFNEYWVSNKTYFWFNILNSKDSLLAQDKTVAYRKKYWIEATVSEEK